MYNDSFMQDIRDFSIKIQQYGTESTMPYNLRSSVLSVIVHTASGRLVGVLFLSNGSYEQNDRRDDERKSLEKVRGNL